ncbi:MAG: transglycosylase SLT domain-containing protein [Saprospiraceae bacterium]|nr:transglycosylase SLT domain-containing protein [Pyrinomonadaceae bacterium]
MQQYNSFSAFAISTIFATTLFITACSAQQNEQQALQSLREMTKDGKLPPESIVANVESRFAGKQTGALAKLLRARIRFENNDFAGAAAILNSNDFQTKTNLGDYALWLRGRSLQSAGNHSEAMNVFAKLIGDFADSIRAGDAKLLWADSAIQSGQASKVPEFLRQLNDSKSAGALLRTAKAYESQGNQPEAVKFYRRVYFFGAGTDSAKEAEAKLTLLAQPLTPQNAEEAQSRADKHYNWKNYAAAEKAYGEFFNAFPASATSAVHLKRLITFSNLKKMTEAQNAFGVIPASAIEKEEAYYQLALGYAKARLWPNARQTAEEMRLKFPNGKLTPKAWVDAGMAARDGKNKLEEAYFLRSALTAYPSAIEVAGAQFELAWLEHENKNFAQSSQMLIEHLARYAEKDTTNRGKAGYWAARDSEKAGKIGEACALYEGVTHRYSANWYGHIGAQRLATLKGQGKCNSPQAFPSGSLVPKAVANLRTVTVAAETSTPKEIERAEKSEQLSIIGLFDWAIDELEEAKKTAQNSPKINLALAKHYRLKGSNVNALLALAKSYPDYAQMFPEEMGRDEWDIFYPLTNWDQITAWAKNRDLDKYQVAGLIRQESVFDPKARSGAKAYGLMQLLLPTARLVARSFGSTANLASAEALYQPAVNIELGTGYMKQQLDKFGRIEYMAVAYNAGPGRVNQWRPTLPAEMDEFVEAIPFKETKGYVQGIIRNSAQYRRLYDENGNFKSNVGTRPLRGEIDSKTREQIAAEFPEVVVEDRASE